MHLPCLEQFGQDLPNQPVQTPRFFEPENPVAACSSSISVTFSNLQPQLCSRPCCIQLIGLDTSLAPHPSKEFEQRRQAGRPAHGGASGEYEFLVTIPTKPNTSTSENYCILIYKYQYSKAVFKYAPYSTSLRSPCGCTHLAMILVVSPGPEQVP